MPMYKVNALVHLNVTREVMAEDKSHAVSIMQSTFHTAFPEECALVDVQSVD